MDIKKNNFKKMCVGFKKKHKFDTRVHLKEYFLYAQKLQFLLFSGGFYTNLTNLRAKQKQKP